jgi:hypothetical protein
MKTVQAARGMVVVVDSGERLIASLTRKLRELGLQGGWLSGVGSVTDVELGYYDLEKKEYVRRRFSERYELLGLTGNLSLEPGGEAMVHAHALLGTRDFQVFGGHVMEATVTATAAEARPLPRGRPSTRTGRDGRLRSWSESTAGRRTRPPTANTRSSRTRPGSTSGP